MPGSNHPSAEDRHLAQLAVQRMYITKDEAAVALRKQKSLYAQGETRRLADLLVEEELLTAAQAEALTSLRHKASGKPANIKSTWVFGRVAKAMGLITAEQASRATRIQEGLKEEGVDLKFGEVLLRENYIDREALDQVLAVQKAMPLDPDDLLFGAVAVENGFLEEKALEACLESQQELAADLSDPEAVPRIAELLLMEEEIDAEAVEAILKVQERLKARMSDEAPPRPSPPKAKTKGLKARSPAEALFLKLAVRNGFLETGHLSAILEMQQSDPRPRSAGMIAVDLGYLDPMDVAAIEEVVARREGLGERRKKHRTTAMIKIGEEDASFSEIAVQNGFLERDQIQEAERAYKHCLYLGYPRNLGEIYYDLGLLTADKIEAVLDIQRLKGEACPAYRLEEVTLTEAEDERLAEIVKKEKTVGQEQVTECMRIHRELRKLGIRRTFGEILLVKGYVFRDALKRKAPVRKRASSRRRSEPRTGADPTRRKMIIAAGVAGGLGVCALLVALLLTSGGGGASGEGLDKAKAAGENVEVPEETSGNGREARPETPDGSPPPGRDPVKMGYVKWKGRWIPKRKRKAASRKRFYEAFRLIVRHRNR